MIGPDDVAPMTQPKPPAPGTPEHAAAEERLNDVLSDVVLRLAREKKTPVAS